MKLKDINEIKEDGLVVFMPSGIQATLFNEGKKILVKYYNLKEDRYTIKDFKKVMAEGIEVFSDQPTIPQQSVLMESEEPELDTYQFTFITQTDEDVLVTDVMDGREFELSATSNIDKELLLDELEEQMDMLVAPELCEYTITGTEIVGFKYDEETGEGSFEFNIFYENNIDWEDEDDMDESVLDMLHKKGYIRDSLMEAYEKVKNPEGQVFKALKDKKKEYITADYKKELLTCLDRIARDYPDVKIRQQALTFMDEINMQEYWDTKAVQDFCKKHLEVLDQHINESLSEDENSMAEEIRRGNKSGQDPKFGNWLLETSLDEKWEQLTNDMKLYLMDGIADFVQQGSLKEQDLLLEIDPMTGLTKEDVQSLEMFDQEEINYTFSSEDLQLNAYISYEVKTDLDTPKDMEESVNEDIYLKKENGEEVGPFENQEAEKQYIKDQKDNGNEEEYEEIIKEENMSKKNEDCYKVYNTIDPDSQPLSFNSWNEVEDHLNKEWGDYKVSMTKENAEFGTDEDRDNFMGNFEIAIEPIEIPAEEIPAEGIELETEPVIEPEEEVCPECGKEPCECETEEPIDDLEEDFEDEHIGKSEEEPIEEPEQEETEEETEEEINTPEEAADKVDEIDDALDSLEDFLNTLIGDEELTQEEQDEIEALDLPAVVEQLDETPVDESLKEDTTVLDNGKEFKVDDKAFDIVRQTLLDVMDGYGWVDIEQLQDYIKEEGLELTDEELIAVAKACLKYTRVFDASELQDTDLQDIEDAYGTVIVVDNFKRLPKNEDFKDGMLTDINDLDFPDALANTVETKEDGSLYRLGDLAKEIEEVKSSMEEFKNSFKSELATMLQDLKNDLKLSVNNVETKVQDTKSAVDNLTSEEEDLADIEFDQEEAPVEEQGEEAPEEGQEEPSEEETEEEFEESLQGNRVYECIKAVIKNNKHPKGMISIPTIAEKLREDYGIDTNIKTEYGKQTYNQVANIVSHTSLKENVVDVVTEERERKRAILGEAVNWLGGGLMSKLEQQSEQAKWENLEKVKQEIDQAVQKGADAEQLKDQITLSSEDENEEEQAKDYAVQKLQQKNMTTESLLATLKNTVNTSTLRNIRFQ